MSDIQSKKANNIIIENRKSINVSGVSDVGSFSESSVVLYTSQGLLVIKGADLHMGKLSVESGEVLITGTINALSYSDNVSGKNESILKKILR